MRPPAYRGLLGGILFAARASFRVRALRRFSLKIESRLLLSAAAAAAARDFQCGPARVQLLLLRLFSLRRRRNALEENCAVRLWHNERRVRGKHGFGGERACVFCNDLEAGRSLILLRGEKRLVQWN